VRRTAYLWESEHPQRLHPDRMPPSVALHDIKIAGYIQTLNQLINQFAEVCSSSLCFSTIPC
jgi:hypothetical protein